MRRLLLAFSLFAVPALADKPPASPYARFMEDVYYNQASPRATPSHCDALSILAIQAGNTLTGPIDVGVVNGLPALHLDSAAVLTGSVNIEVCDGRVTISSGVVQ